MIQILWLYLYAVLFVFGVSLCYRAAGECDCVNHLHAFGKNSEQFLPNKKARQTGLIVDIHEAHVNESNFGRILRASLAFTILCLLYMKYIDAQFSNEQAPLGQVSFQVTFTLARVKEVTDSWTNEQKNWVLYSFFIDNIFMVAYGFTFILGVIYASDAKEDR